jgi:hypothetical protein
MKIWYNIVLIGVRRVDEGVKCVVGARTQKESSLSLRDLEKGVPHIILS